MTMHISETNCTGCLACENICPVSAISHTDNNDFIRPIINENVCVNCGKCLQVCPQSKEFEENKFFQKAYAVQHLDLSILAQSTSGGAFSSIADNILQQNGSIYGCVLENCTVRHIRVEKDYHRMRGSKYVQSDLGNTYLNIEKDIKEGRKVLFTGTPCQCAAVKSFLLAKKNPSDNLILVDFVCHGITSPLLFREYLLYYEQYSGKSIVDHLFRSKINGWTNHTEMNVLCDGTEDYASYESQLFKSIFHSHLGMNESCFKCKYASLKRVSDITLADFWGLNESHPELFDQRGVSFVLVNSAKGWSFFNSCKNIKKSIVSISDTKQPALCGPVNKPEKYECFWRDYRRKGFRYVVKKYYCGGKFHRAISDIYHRLFKR